MAIAVDTFEQGVALKRKRSSEETDERYFDPSRHLKRTNLTYLPIRNSPFPNQEQFWQSTVPDTQQPLTPVDSSDEERCDRGRLWQRRHQSPSTAQRRFHLYNPPMVMVEDDMMNDYDCMSMDPTIAPTATDTVSIPPPPPPNKCLFASTVSCDERAPTPIRANFRKLENTTRGRRLNFTLPSVLSPVMAEDLYLPSPVESSGPETNADPETMMSMEHASSGFGALTVACNDDEMMEDMNSYENADNTTRARSIRANHRKNARLHMGFRADCEKCQQRVPGHYSHIIWE